MKLILIFLGTCLGLVTSLSIPDDGKPSCPIPSNEDCAKCDLIRNPQRFLPNPCSCGYFQCQTLDDSNKVFSIVELKCPKCTCWNQEYRTCDHDPGANNCTSVEIQRTVTSTDTKCTDKSTGYEMTLGAVPNDIYSYYQYVWGTEYTMACAPGTHFSLEKCTCILGGIIERKPMMCLSFDGVYPFTPDPYVYVDEENVTIVQDGVIGKAAYFDGFANIEIPLFDGKESAELTFLFWYKRQIGGADPLQAIFSNDNCDKADILGPSIQIRSDSPDTVGAGFHTDQNNLNAYENKPADVEEWHHVALVYNGNEITLYLDGVKLTPVTATGLIKSVQCPLRIGSMYNKNFFRGFIDELCIYDYAVDEDAIEEHFLEGLYALGGSESGSGSGMEELESCPTAATDCQDHLDLGNTQSGLYCITLGSGDNKRPVMIQCEMSTDGTAWNVILKRYDGSVDFENERWAGFKKGLGSADGEYYLGNDNVHDLTVNNGYPYMLRIDIESESGLPGFARYNYFAIGDENDKYKLDVGIFDRSSSLSDCLTYNDEQYFSTSDQDNDSHTVHCAQVNTGGWWYNQCTYCKLMSGYGPLGTQYNRIWWNGFRNVWIKKAEMKLKRGIVTGMEAH